MTPEEYEQYLRFISKKTGVRPEQITADAIIVPSLIILAVGVLFTVAGSLLAPKPKQQEQRQIRNKRGDDERGRSRFSPTYGFDSQTELASYGTPIPIHFGNDKPKEQREKTQSNWPITLSALLCNDCTRYTPSPNYSGGMLVSPLLVWSRMYSMGRGQLFQGMYVVGERMDSGREYDPRLSGIWIGNNTLDKLSDKNFAFYYDNEGGAGRLRSVDLRHGTHSDDDSGNPFLAKKIDGYRSWAEPFPTPVCDMDESSGFSMTYSLSNQSTFGCYSPIMNGTDRRPPWRVISLPKSQDGDAEDQVKLEREKISGGEDRMEPSGRGYGRLMGLTKHNGDSRGSKDKPRWDTEVQRGDTVRFEILSREYDDDLYEKGDVEVSVEDLVNESDADRQAADDALQIGEEFMINCSRFRVVKRDKDVYEMNEDGTWADLECIEDRDASSQIGFVSRDYFEQDICDKDSKISIFQQRHVPPHWSPLLKYELASFRNMRKADVTEIGIKSRVWAQMNGMCNFPSIPTSNELRDNYDKKDVQYTNGVQSQYFTRFSFFKLYMRDPADSDVSSVSSWKDVRVIFAIRGNEPVDQYNYIRIKPNRPKQYEYRLFPLTSGWATKRERDPDDWGTDDVAWVLDVAKGDDFRLVKTIKTIGKVEISSVGRLIGVRCAVTSPLMLGKRDKDYADDDDAFCQDDWCEGFGGRVDVDLDDDDDATNGLDKELEDTCEGDTCFEPEEESRGARQEAFWNRLAAIEEAEEANEEVPDYIKDGFDVGCVDCSSSWDADDAPEVAPMGGCDERYEDEESGRPGSGNDRKVVTGISHVRTARGPGASSSVDEKWLWKGKTIWSGSKNDASNPMKDEVKEGGKVYKVGDRKIRDGGSTSGYFTYAIKQCDSSGGDSDGGGGGGGSSEPDSGCSKPHWTIFEYATQVNEGSYYAGLINRSCDSGAEHQIVYVNESKKPKEVPMFESIAMMGLSLRATRQFNNLDQPRLFLRGGIAVNQLQDAKYSSGFNIEAKRMLGEDAEFEEMMELRETRSKPDKIRVTMTHTVKCSTKDRRIIKVVAGFMDERGDKTIDPNNDAADRTRWNVQWFKGKTRDNAKKLKDPEWYNTEVLEDWTSRSPHTTIIRGRVAQIQVPKDSGWYTCYMWPGESNTEDYRDINNESGINKGPDENDDKLKSLSLIQFNSNDEIIDVITNGVEKIDDERTEDGKYEATYDYLWSGRRNYSFGWEDNSRYIYWYIIDSARQEIEIETGTICPGDTKPPGPGNFSVELIEGDGTTGSELKCKTQNCGGSIQYEWQYRTGDSTTWGTPPGPVLSNKQTFTPGQAGYYRCKAYCTENGETVIKKTDQTYVKSSFGDVVPPISPDPDPPDEEPPVKPPGEGGGGSSGMRPSNNYADLIYWLLTDKRSGAGQVVNDFMVDKDRMIVTSKFVARMGFTWDGSLSETTNLRSFASATAPFFLCNFTVTNGKFTLWPVIPVDRSGRYKGKKVFIKQLFTEGNIIDGSFSLDYLDADDRRPFKAAMRYRVMSKEQVPEERTLTSRWYTGKFTDPTEEFDMTQFCTTPEHAQLAARYFMWIRNVVTHSVKFQTVPEVMNSVGPGDFIKVRLESATIQREKIASVGDFGRINSAEVWEDGEHEVHYWIAGMDEPGQRMVEVKDGEVTDPTMRRALMSHIRNGGGEECNPIATCYQVESVSLEEDGLVQVVASYYPVDTKGVADLYNALFGLGRYEGLCGGEVIEA